MIPPEIEELKIFKQKSNKTNKQTKLRSAFCGGFHFIFFFRYLNFFSV